MRWLMVDKLVECDPGERAIGVKCFSFSDPIFMDHFPGLPIVPGVVQIEMIAQTGGKCIRLKNRNVLPALGTVKSAKFIKSIEPGDQCFIHVEVTKLRESYAMATGQILVDGKKVSEAEILFAMIPKTKLDPNHKDLIVARWEEKLDASKEKRDE